MKMRWLRSAVQVSALNVWKVQRKAAAPATLVTVHPIVQDIAVSASPEPPGSTSTSDRSPISTRIREMPALQGAVTEAVQPGMLAQQIQRLLILSSSLEQLGRRWGSRQERQEEEGSQTTGKVEQLRCPPCESNHTRKR